MQAVKPIIRRGKIRFTLAPNGINWNVVDTNEGRTCTAEILNVGRNGWNVRIDKDGVSGWKYAANIPTKTPEGAYEYCHEFGRRVEE